MFDAASTWRNVFHDRQKEIIMNSLRARNEKVGKTLEHKAVRGSTNFMQRPGAREFIDDCKEAGITKIVFSDETRFQV